jgi:hypothetical protein
MQITSVRGPPGSGVGVTTWRVSTGVASTTSVTTRVSTTGSAVAGGGWQAARIKARMSSKYCDLIWLNILSSSFDELLPVFSAINTF